MTVHPTKRMQFEFSLEHYDAIVNLKRRTDSASYADAVKRAVRLHDFVHEATSNGSKVCIQDASGNVTPIVLLEI